MDLTWVEPREYWMKRRNTVGENPIRQALYGLAVFAAFSLFRLLGTVVPGARDQQVNWLIFLPSVFVGSMILAFLWPRAALWLTASHVVISKKGVNNNMQTGTNIRFQHWPWSQLGPTRIVDSSLVLSDSQNREIVRLGIDSKITLERIKESVISNGGEWLDENSHS